MTVTDAAIPTAGSTPGGGAGAAHHTEADAAAPDSPDAPAPDAAADVYEGLGQGGTVIAAVRSIEFELGALMRRLRAAKDEIARLIDPDMAASTYTVLVLVADRQPTRAGEIVDVLDMDKSAVSRHLTTLAEMGLVHRACDPEDRRSHTIALTEDGEQKLRAAFQFRRNDISARLGDWTLPELRSFAEQLARFNSAVE